MTVTASFQPSTTLSPPGTPAELTLRLHNATEDEQVVKLAVTGDFAGHTALQSETIYLDPDESFDVIATVEVPVSAVAGNHAATIEVSGGTFDKFTAEATITVDESVAYSVGLRPERSSSGGGGKHHIDVKNVGNTPIMVEIVPEPTSDLIQIELAAPMVNVDPGASAKVELKVHPRDKFWSGPTQEHPFTVIVTGSDQEIHQLDGVYAQGPRVRPWLLPAAAGMIGSLALGTLAWFTVLKPSVQSIADERAEAALVEQQAAFDATVAELEAAAERARQLPLGVPADLRLEVETSAGETDTDSYTVASDRVLSVTDVVLQNPGGAIGRVALLRNGEVLLESELANFRDLDQHFVAPFRFEKSATVELRVECEAPGPNEAACSVGATIVGFVDQAG